MRNFNITKEVRGDVVELKISGYFSEEVQMPGLEQASVIKIDLSNVSGLNSFGIKCWCQWVKAIPATTTVQLIKCPIIFVKAFNTVSGFLTPNMDVASFLVPYYSQGTNARQDVLYVKGENYGPGKPLTHPTIVDASKQPMEIDATPNYFKFVERMA